MSLEKRKALAALRQAEQEYEFQFSRSSPLPGGGDTECVSLVDMKVAEDRLKEAEAALRRVRSV